MYKIQVSTSCDITLVGRPINPFECPIVIRNGSNWIAFPYSESMPLTVAFAGLNPVDGDTIKSMKGNAIYIGGRWRGIVAILEPGQGYIYMSKAQVDRTFTFPMITN